MALWKNNPSPIVTQNSFIGMFEMSKPQKIDINFKLYLNASA